MLQQKEQTSSALKYRAVGRSDNSEVPVLFGGHNLPQILVEIGLTDLPKVPWHPREETPEIDTTYCIRIMFVCLHDFIHESQILSHA